MLEFFGCEIPVQSLQGAGTHVDLHVKYPLVVQFPPKLEYVNKLQRNSPISYFIKKSWAVEILHPDIQADK